MLRSIRGSWERVGVTGYEFTIWFSLDLCSLNGKDGDKHFLGQSDMRGLWKLGRAKLLTWKTCNVGKAIIHNPPIWMVYSTHLWKKWGWVIIALPLARNPMVLMEPNDEVSAETARCGIGLCQFRYHGNPVLKTPKTKEVGNLYTVTYNIEKPMNTRLVFVTSMHVCWLYQHFSCELHQLSLRHLRLGSSGWISMNFPFKTLNKDALFFWTWRKIMSSTIGFWSAIFLDIWAGLFSRLDG